MGAITELKDLALNSLEQRYPTLPKNAIPQPKYTDKTTNGLTKCVINWIELNGHQAERINSTGRMLDNRKTVTDVMGHSRSIGSTTYIKSTGTIGTADISATIKGRSVKIEIKCKATGDDYQSKGQKAYQNKIEEAGGIYIIVRTFDEFYNWYNEFVNNHKNIAICQK